MAPFIHSSLAGTNVRYVKKRVSTRWFQLVKSLSTIDRLRDSQIRRKMLINHVLHDYSRDVLSAYINVIKFIATKSIIIRKNAHKTLINGFKAPQYFYKYGQSSVEQLFHLTIKSTLVIKESNANDELCDESATQQRKWQV